MASAATAINRPRLDQTRVSATLSLTKHVWLVNRRRQKYDSSRLTSPQGLLRSHITSTAVIFGECQDHNNKGLLQKALQWMNPSTSLPTALEDFTRGKTWSTTRDKHLEPLEGDLYLATAFWGPPHQEQLHRHGDAQTNKASGRRVSPYLNDLKTLVFDQV